MWIHQALNKALVTCTSSSCQSEIIKWGKTTLCHHRGGKAGPSKQPKVIFHGLLGVLRKGLSLKRMTAMSLQVLKKCLRNAITLPGRQGHPIPVDRTIRALPLLVSSLANTVHILLQERRKRVFTPRRKNEALKSWNDVTKIVQLTCRIPNTKI